LNTRESTILTDIKRSSESLPQGKIAEERLKTFCHPDRKRDIDILQTKLSEESVSSIYSPDLAPSDFFGNVK
jgi:hypothetical protein